MRGSFTVEFTDAEAAIKDLEELVPKVKASPGFVAGYWVRLDPSHGTSIAVFVRHRGPGPRHGTAHRRRNGRCQGHGRQGRSGDGQRLRAGRA